MAKLESSNAMLESAVNGANQMMGEYDKDFAKQAEVIEKLEKTVSTPAHWRAKFEQVEDQVQSLKELLEKCQEALKYYAYMPEGHTLGDGCGHFVAVEVLKLIEERNK